MNKLILASGSPRRKELFGLLNIDYEIITSNIEEIVNTDILPEDLVMDLAFQKAMDVFKSHKERIVLGFDTLVYIKDELLGKPKSKEDAIAMLRKLSGNTHIVLTGCAVISKSISKSFYEKTRVTFYDMTDTEILEYVESGEPMDKAGAYGIQGLGSKYVKHVNGDYFSVMGFPVSRVYHELKALEII
jgi:septum formation protein